MHNTRKVLFVFIIILIQSAMAISAGVAAIYLTAGGRIPSGIIAGNADIGGLDESKAEKKIDEYYGSIFKGNSLEIIINGRDKFNIPYADIEVSVNSAATLDMIRNKWSAHYLPDLLKAYFGHDKVIIAPVVKLNEGKLRKKLIELSRQIDKAPINASIHMENGKIVKKADTNGLVLNIANAVESIKMKISQDPLLPIAFNNSVNNEIQSVPAKIRIKDFDGIEQVIADYSTIILDNELLDSIRISSDAINGVILQPETSGGGASTEFSFVGRLNAKDAGFDNDNEGYDQVASTLYAAVLNAGIRKDAITRLPHKLAAEYIDPGLDAWISGNAGDLKFSNTLGHKLAIFSEIKDNRLTISLVGNISDKKEKYILKTDIIQKSDPPVVNMENSDLKPGERVMLSPGKQGMTVNVFRNQELISTDKYDAVRAIVQIGPKTDWSNGK